MAEGLSACRRRVMRSDWSTNHSEMRVYTIPQGSRGKEALWRKWTVENKSLRHWRGSLRLFLLPTTWAKLLCSNCVVINIMLLWWAACHWHQSQIVAFDSLLMHSLRSNPNRSPVQTCWANRQGSCHGPGAGLVYASRAQSAGPGVEMNGDEWDRKYKQLLSLCPLHMPWPFLVFFGSLTWLCLLPRWAQLSLWPLHTLFGQ